MLGRNLDRLAEAQRIGFHCSDFAVLALGLVGDQHHRLVGAAREVGKGAVVRRQPHPCVDHEQQRIGQIDRGLGLLLHPCRQRALGALVEAGGIDHGEFEVAQPSLAFTTVAGHAGFIVDQRQLLPDQAIEQRRFPDIGPADNGERERHKEFLRAASAYGVKTVVRFQPRSSSRR